MCDSAEYKEKKGNEKRRYKSTEFDPEDTNKGTQEKEEGE
jgi:hypothetical protein